MAGPATVVTAATALGCCLVLVAAAGVGTWRRSDPDSPGPGRAAPRRRLLLSPGVPTLDEDGDGDAFEMGKRERMTSVDDYGHMRFGKRERGEQDDKFDDYGHMRFGRAGP